jgi:outer membrane protein TolC
MVWKRTTLTIAVLTLLLSPALGGAQAQPQAQAAAAEGKSLRLTLDECIVRALKSNLAIQVAEYTPQQSEVSLSDARSQYLPTMSLQYSPSHTENAAYSWLDTTGATTVRLANNYTGSINELTPLGGTFSLSMTSNRSDTNARATTINPRYSTNLRFSYNQPLLRNFGPKMTNRTITIARNNLDSSEVSFVNTVQSTIYSVIQSYWNLVYSVENLKVQKLGLQLSKELLEKNRRSVEIGTMAPLDVLTAEADVASREAGILAAEASVKANEDSLKVLINLSAEEEKGLQEIVALDSPAFDEETIELEQALATAMEKRPDIRISRINMKNTDINLSYAKNQLLPDFRLNASWSSPGLSGTQLVYQGNNPLSGVVIDSIPGFASDAWKSSFGFKYQNWSVSLTLNVDLSDYLTRANYVQAKLSKDQALLSLTQQEQLIIQEIRNSVRAVQTSYKQVQAYKLARELSEQKYNAELEKLRIGQSTDYLVLQYLRDMTSARVLELNSIIGYNIAQAGLERSMGTLLEKRNIKVAELLRD